MFNDNFKVTRALPGNTISGKIVAAGKRGQIVQIKGSTVAGKPGVFNPDVEVQLATGTRGFHLERDVVVGPVDVVNFVFDVDFLIPDIINPDTNIGYVSARKVQEFEVEGADLVDVSLDETTPVGSPVTSKAGKVALKTTNDELYGYVRGQLAAHDPDNNDFRLLVEVVE